MEKMSRPESDGIKASLEMSIQREPPAWASGVVVFVGMGFILTSLFQLGLAMNLGYYNYLFQDYPAEVIRMRHLVSCGARLMGVVFGVGFLCRKEFFRKALIFLSFATMLLVYWKHPYAGVVRHLQYSNELATSQGLPFSPESVINYLQAWNVSWVTVSWLAQVLLGFFIISDICFALIVIFLLTRPAVKSLFR